MSNPKSNPKISIIHPSRGRYNEALKCAKEWIGNADNPQDIEYIFSCDFDDSQREAYRDIFNNFPEAKFTHKVYFASNNNVVQAMNTGAVYSTGSILVCVSDDFGCFQGWDTWLLANVDATQEVAVKVNDTISKMDNLILTIPILTRKLYLRIGHVYEPDTTGIFSDNILAERCQKMGVLRCYGDVVMKHFHWVNGHKKRDDINNRHDNPAGWKLGEQILNRERKNNFGIK